VLRRPQADDSAAILTRLVGWPRHETVDHPRVLETCGFSLEGLLRGHSEFLNLVPIEPRDVLCFATLL
jgi:hypothetical protein